MIAITSIIQERAYRRGEVPPAEMVREGILAVALPMPGRDLPFSLAYAIEAADGSLHLVDSGMDTEENLGLLGAALHTIGRSIDDIASVTATHMHHDHIGLARRIRAASGARVGLHRRDAELIGEGEAAREPTTAAGTLAEHLRSWAVPADRLDELIGAASGSVSRVRVPIDLELSGGEVLDVPGRRLRVLPTPGHTTGHIVVRDEDLGIQFAGDHLLAVMFPGLGLGYARPGDDPIGDYQASLATVAAHADDEVCPGHGHRFTGVAERCAETSAHHARRTAEVRAAVEAHPRASVWEIASRITWTAGWSNLRGEYLHSALAQTVLHLAHLGRAPADN